MALLTARSRKQANASPAAPLTARDRNEAKSRPVVKGLPELVAEAQADDMPELMTWAAAVDKPAALLRRYRRHWEADNARGWAIWQKPALFGIGAGAAVFILTLIGFGIISDSAMMGPLLGLLLGLPAGWALAVKVMWEEIHSPVTITDGNDAKRPWHATYIMHLFLPSLGFRLRPETQFGQGDRPAIRLFVQSGLERLDNTREIYHYRPAYRHMEFSVLEDTYERLKGEAGNGLELKRTEKEDKCSFLKEMWGRITLGVCIAIAAYCIIQMSDGMLIGRPDVELYEKQLQQQQTQRLEAAPPAAAAEPAERK